MLEDKEYVWKEFLKNKKKPKIEFEASDKIFNKF